MYEDIINYKRHQDAHQLSTVVAQREIEKSFREKNDPLSNFR